ncbi:Rid family hydrolase [Nakamurella alba]|uniref:Rid family hydrolase n=1 Tax=Nakamurella alba TaxID=2665158 RepID=UPI0018A951C7|nr:RidA family protein [Nakamurella alba]
MSSKRVAHNVPGADFPEWYPSSSVVTAGPYAFTASMSAVDFATGVAPAASVSPGLPRTTGHPVKLQVRETYRRLSAALGAVGSSLEAGVSINQWQPTFRGDAVRDDSAQNAYVEHWEAWRDVAHAYIQGRNEFLIDDRPASCLLPVDRLVAKDSLIEIQLVSLLDDSGISKRAYAHDVHNPLGGYSVGMEAGPLLFSAGFIPTDFESGLHPNARVPQHIWYGNQVAAETAETLRQIRITMESAGADWADVVKVVLYLTPEGMRNLPAVEEVWQQNWPDSPPARAIVPVSGIGGVKGGNVEIFVIVARRDAGGDREVITAPDALPAIGHQVQAIRSGEFLFLSTQLGRSADGPLPAAVAAQDGLPFTRRALVDQVRAIHEDVAKICAAAGTSIENTVKADLYLTDFGDLATLFEVWPEPFTDGLPAAGFFEVPPGSLEVPGCTVAADIIVHCPQG